MKQCKKCNKEKELDKFYNSTKYKDGKESCCKECKLKTSKKNYDEHPEIKKLYRENNIKKIQQDSRDYFIKNPDYNKNRYKLKKDEISQYNKEYYNNNLEYFHTDERKKYKKEWSKNNREKINTWFKNEYYNNPIFKLSNLVRSNINSSIKRGKFSKRLKTTDILGCSFEEFKLYIESKFEPWMNWENQGLYNGELNYGWDIDHIIPTSSVETEEELFKLFHYKNLQPLCSYINRHIKKDRLDYKLNKL